MRRRSWPTWLMLALLLLPMWAASVVAGPEDGRDAPSTSAAYADKIEAALGAGIRPGNQDELYAAAIVEEGDTGPLEKRLRAMRENSAVPEVRRDAATWVEAQLLRRAGRLKDSLALFQGLAAKQVSVLPSLEVAKLHDMLGDSKEAWAVWQDALTKIEPDDPEALRVRIRMALLGKAGGKSVTQALAAVAQESSVEPALRNRAATVLALRGHPKEALALFVPGQGATKPFREQVRLADWALAAGDLKRAQEHAWKAQETATLERDRRYALAVLVESHRADKSLDALIERLAGESTLSESGRKVWIDLLRETGRIDEALRLFREAAAGRFTVDMRRELLEICRESGREETLVGAYREMIAAEPAVTEWREGLSRHYLERGARAKAEDVWASYGEDPKLSPYLLSAAEALQGIGLDELAEDFAERSVKRGQAEAPARLFLFQLHRQRGRMDAAEGELARLDEAAAPTAPERMALAEAYEQIGRKKLAVKIMQGLRDARGPEGAAEDMEMRLAWLYSEVGEEEKALALWMTLWKRINSVSRRRYVEDRLMSVAARLGKLADIAIDLEERLSAGTADARDSGMLVRLYTKAGDPISATEVIEEYMRGTGAAQVKVLLEKSRVFLACTDYHGYEKTIEALIEVDPEGRGDYLRQLAMSRLERGKPESARAVLKELARTEAGSDSAEFEAGVLALAGLREEAVQAYRKGLARYPDRIESLLLMGGLMAQLGKQSEAIGMLQHIAESAEKDDLFMIAIDGLLNLEAPPEVLRWARRITLERLTRRHDKMYLYQLVADLSEQTSDQDVMERALEGALPIIGERRSSLLRELMDHTARGPEKRDRHLAYGRRLIGLGEIAPPQVYLDLGRAFLESGEVSNAAKTFSLATDVPDYASFQQQIATAFETAGYRSEALRTYQRLLLSQPNDVGMLTKVGELQEQVGRDDLAVELYARAMDVMIARRPLSTVVKEKKEPARSWWAGNRNVDAFDQYEERVRTGLLATLDPGLSAQMWLLGVRTKLAVDLQALAELRRGEEEEAPVASAASAELRAWPRISARSSVYRRVAIAQGRPDLADELDLTLLQALPKDPGLLGDLVRNRLRWGLVASARRLIDDSGRAPEEQRKLRFLVGGDGASAPGLISLLEANRLFLPLVVSGQEEEARALLRRLDFSTVSEDDKVLMPVLQSAALQMNDSRLSLALGRHWIKVLIKKDKRPDAPYRFQPVLQRLRIMLDDSAYRSLCEYVVSLIMADPKKAARWISVLPELQRSFQEPLLTEDQRKELAENIDGSRWYWIGSLFALVPPEERPQILRGALPKVPKTQRVPFTLRLVDDIKEEMDQDLKDLVAQSFDESLSELDKAPTYVWFSFINLARGQTHLDLRLRMVDLTLAKKPGKALVRAARAVLLKRLGRDEEALGEASEVLPELLGAKTHYTITNARRLILDEFLPTHLDRLLQVIDERSKEGGGSLALTMFRIELVQRSKDPAALLDAYRQAANEHPDNTTLRTRLRGQLNSMGYTLEALGMAEDDAQEKPDDEARQEQLIYAWRRVGNPVKALEIARALDAKRKKEQGDEPARESVNRFIQPRHIKALLDKGEEDEAALALRRSWRNFELGMGDARFRGMVYYGPRAYSQPWPRDRDSAAAEDPRRLRSGLVAFDMPRPEAPEAQDMNEALAAYDFALADMQRELRTYDGTRLSSAGKLLDGVALGRVRKDGTKRVVEHLLREARAGRAGKLQYGLLLALFAKAPAEGGADVRQVLEDLERTLDPKDAGSLRRLARVWAELGDMERAARIYRWCGTRATSSTAYSYRSPGDAPSIPTSVLVKEVDEVLKGDLREETIEAILAFGDPGTDVRGGPSALDAHRRLVLETWTDILGPERALARCRELCEVIAAGGGLPMRRSAVYAAGLLARGGETKAALRCLEQGLCKLPPSPDVPSYMRFYFDQSPRLTQDDMRRLFPREAKGFQEERAWLLGVAEAFPRWVKEGRAEASSLFQPLALAAVRLERVGAHEEALALLPLVKAWGGSRASSLLWTADVARAVGEKDEAAAIEDALLEDFRLNPYRAADALDRRLAREGVKAAVHLGEEKAPFLRHPAFLEALIRACEAGALGEQATSWHAAKAEVEAAREALATRDEAR